MAACHVASGIVDNGACASGAPGTFTTVAPSMRSLLALLPLPNLPGTTNNFAYGAPVKTDEYYGQIRLDHSFSDKDTMFARFTADNETKPSPTAIPVIVNEWDSISNFSTLSENHIFTPSVLNTARASFSHTYINYQDGSGVAARGPGLSFGNNPNLTTGTVSIPGYTGISTNVVPLFDKQNVYTLSDDVFWTKGKHSLKFGTLLNRFAIPMQSNYFQLGLAVFPALPFFLTGHAVVEQLSSVDPGIAQNRNYHYFTAGFYLGDDYRVTSRLTLNLGLRYEFYTTSHDSNNRELRILRQPAGDPGALHHRRRAQLHQSGCRPAKSVLQNFQPARGICLGCHGQRDYLPPRGQRYFR